MQPLDAKIKRAGYIYRMAWILFCILLLVGSAAPLVALLTFVVWKSVDVLLIITMEGVVNLFLSLLLMPSLQRLEFRLNKLRAMKAHQVYQEGT